MLEYAIASGLASSGADVYLLHVTTTPSVSYITLEEGFDLGVMITASHNPFIDNGIKIIDSRGRKLGDDLTKEIEEYIDFGIDDPPFVKGAEIGRIYDHYAGRNAYIGHLIATASNSYKGVKIGLDAANGSAFAIARSVFAALGAEVHSIGDDPNGMNTNYECGSTHPERLCKMVREKHLDVGFAFDGDADRCIAVDENGNIVDGDAILYILAKSLKKNGALRGDKIAITVMSNSGLIRSLSNEGIGAEITAVGDRFVYDRMQEMDLSLGGEQSGHIIISDLGATGDGILTAIVLADEMIDNKCSLTELCRGFLKFAQRNESIRVTSKSEVLHDEDIIKYIEDLNRENASGRILVRASGTEPKIRVMAEAESQAKCDKIVESIISITREKGYIDE
jgi:phosphoglucosamine mutase